MDGSPLTFASRIASFAAPKLTVAFGGEIDLYAADFFKEQLFELIDQGGREVTLDFSDVRFIDSTTLGALVTVFRRLQEIGGSLCVVTGAGQPSRVLAISGFDRLFPIRIVQNEVTLL